MNQDTVSTFCDILSDELNRNYQIVILIPAPEQRHNNHMIRVQVQGCPDWYSNLYHTYFRVGRKIVFRALEKLKNNPTPKSRLDNLLLEIIQDYIDNKYYPC